MFIVCLCFSIVDLLVVDVYLGPRAFAQSPAELTIPPPVPPPTASPVASPIAPPLARALAREGGAHSTVPQIVARFGSDEGAAYEDHLKVLATAMIEDPDATIVLEGHSDRRGTAEYNQALSLQRADWARGQLVLYGVSATRIETVGRGAEFPLEESIEDRARSENRRVEVRWVDK